MNTRLALFFTQGVSLRTWDQVGILDREVAIYQRLQACDISTSFVTYGNRDDLEYQDRVPEIKILCNRWQLPQAAYERWLPIIHGPWLWRTDVIKTNQSQGGDVALRVAQFWRKPLIARCGYMWSDFAAREHGLNSAVAQQAQATEAAIFSAAQGIVVTTPMMKADLAQRIPSAAAQTMVIPNFVDTDHFRPAVNRKPNVDLVFVGRWSAQKNLVSLLDAIQPLDVSLLLIGSGTSQADLQERLGQLNGRLEWRRRVPNSGLPAYLNRAKLFVLPSHYEGHPKVLLEAMACGLPVIGADSPGIRELVHHRQTGYLCGTSPEEIRAALQTVLGNANLQARLGQNARAFAVNNFSLDRIANLESDFIHEVAR